MPLTPEEQSLFQQLQAKAQQGAELSGTAGVQGLFDQQQTAMPAPGSFKDDPEGAMQLLLQRKATGQQLQRDPQGRLAIPRERGPLGKLFGAKPRLDPLIDQTDYLDAIKQAGLTDFLPAGLSRTPEGLPLVSERVADQAKQMAATTKGTTQNFVTDQNTLQLMAAFAKKRAPELAPYIQKAIDDKTGLPDFIAKQLPGLTTRRQQLYMFRTDPRTGDLIATEASEGSLMGTSGPTSLAGLQAGAQGTASIIPPTYRKVLDSAKEDYEGSNVIKKGREAMGFFPGARKMINSDIPAAVGPARMRIVRGLAMEVGNLSRTEVVENSGSRQVFDSLTRFLNERLASGSFSDKDVQDFNDLFDIAENTLRDYLTEESKTFVDAAESRVGKGVYPREMIESYVTRSFTSPTEAPFRETPLVERPQHGKRGVIDKLMGRKGPQQTTPTEGITKSGVKFKVIK